MMCRIVFVVVCFLTSLAGAQETPVRVVNLPDAALVPDAVVDAGGTTHIVYGLGDKALYVRSSDDGKTLSEPVAANAEGKVQLTMGERGPKIALGRGGMIHVVWTDRWSPGAKVFVRAARSTDGGKTFSAPVQLSQKPGCDGTTLAADGKGNVYAFWHTFDPPQQEIPQAHWMYMVKSTDDGATFGEPERVRITNAKDLACSMCLMRARALPDGSVYLAFRTAVDNLRDFYVLKSADGSNSFVATRVNQDNWFIKTCPMCGPELTISPDGTQVCAYMSKHRAYWSIQKPGAGAFDLHVSTPTPENDEIYPSAFANGKGDVLMLWQVGPMAVGKTAVVKWAMYKSDGTFTGRQATLGTSTSGTKPTAFVCPDGSFTILTTAKQSGKQTRMVTKVFLLAGQSNMAGRGAVDVPPRQPHPRVMALGQDGKWAPARDPLHWDKPDMIGVGPGLTFGEAVADAMPNDVIGLVPAAFGGTSIQQWQKDSTDPLHLYATAIERARIVMKDGELAGIIWHQGEANIKRDFAEYQRLFSRMVSDFRKDLSSPDLPVIAGELGHFIDGSQRFNTSLHTLPDAISNLKVVSAEGLTHKGDSLHFDTASARELGARYAKAYLAR